MKIISTYCNSVFRLSIGLILVLFFSCTNDNLIGKLTITESASIVRDLEYVEVEISMKRALLQSETIAIRSEKNGELTIGQLLQSEKNVSGNYVINCLFPVSIDAQETLVFDVLVANDSETLTDLKVEGKGMELIIENEHYIANLTSEKATTENGLGSGQLTSLTVKNYSGQKLQRSHINMHWAPNFQKEGLDYKTIGHISEFDSLFVDQGTYLVTTYRSGKVKGYEEIQVEGGYQFYAGLPYFIFSSKMTMLDSVVLTMLRNDEMTMDSLFTHAMFPLPDGGVKIVNLYDDPPLTPHYSIKELRKTPVDANTDWFCFYNDSMKYGFGSIRIQYDNTNLDSEESPMLNPETRITSSKKGGRYWDRRFFFVKEGDLQVPKGSRYAEKNAYVIFPINPENPAEKISELFDKLTNPVIVKYKEL